jgi:hypothetical protein
MPDVIRILQVDNKKVRMTPTQDQDLHQAIERWLDARQCFGGGNAIGRTLNEYWEADRHLLAAFADGWQGGEIILADAFHHFRKILVQDHERPTIGWRRADLLT